jgi:hypothetical protein
MWEHDERSSWPIKAVRASAARALQAAAHTTARSFAEEFRVCPRKRSFEPEGPARVEESLHPPLAAANGGW